MLGEKLKSLRKAKGYTQRDVADKLGIGRTTYTGYENNTINPPDEKIRLLEKLYLVDLSFEEGDNTQLTLEDGFPQPLKNPMEVNDLKYELLGIINSHTITLMGNKVDEATYIEPLEKLIELYLTGIQVDQMINIRGQKL